MTVYSSFLCPEGISLYRILVYFVIETTAHEQLFTPWQMNWDSVISEMFACGIRNPGKIPESRTLESGIQLKESGILLLKSGIQNPISTDKDGTRSNAATARLLTLMKPAET